MNKNFLLVFIFIVISLNLVNAQSISFVSPTMNETISGGTSQTLIPVSLIYNSVKDNKYPSSERVEYIKLYTETGEYYDNIGNGIPAGTNEMPEQWNLAPGSYHWILEQYEKYTTGGIMVSCSAEIYFYVKHTIKVENNVEGLVKIDFHPKNSGSTTLKFLNEHISVEAPDQEINGNYYVWKYIGSNPSVWKIKKLGENEVYLSDHQFHSYYIQSNDNMAIIKSYLRYDETPPAAPQGLSTSWVNGGEEGGNPRIDWTANTEPDINHYEVWKRRDNYFDPDVDWFLKTTTASNYYIDYDEHGWGTMGPPADVYYKIKAVDLNNNKSSYSNSVMFKCDQYLNKKGGKELFADKPTLYKLEKNYPNPFNPTTTISYQLKENGFVILKVYDVLGKEVAVLVNENKSAGIYNVNFNASNLPSGLYFYKIQAGEFTATRKMLLMK